MKLNSKHFNNVYDDTDVSDFQAMTTYCKVTIQVEGEEEGKNCYHICQDKEPNDDRILLYFKSLNEDYISKIKYLRVFF